MRLTKRCRRPMTAVLAATFLVLSATAGNAIPSFARKYKTSCSTCHYAFPKLNGFGKAFFNNGYRYPGGQDAEMTKEKPVSLGSEGYKRVFPDAIWPSDIPGTSPISINTTGRFNYKPDGDVKTTFETPHEVEILYGGTMGETFSMLGEVEIENEDNETEVAFPFVLQYDHSPALHVTMGNVHVDPSGDHHRLTRNHNNVASLRSRHRWRLRDQHGGIQVWGARNGQGNSGGLTYAMGLVNGQNTEDANSAKDVYFRVAYKQGGLGETGGTAGRESQTSAFWRDDSAKLGAFVYFGSEAKGGEQDEDVRALALTYDLWYNRVNVFGALMSMNSDIPTLADRTSLAWYAEADYVVYPWLIGLARFEYTDADTDDDTDAVVSLVPAVVVMSRANIRLQAEYKLPIDDASKDKDELTLQFDYAF